MLTICPTIPQFFSLDKLGSPIIVHIKQSKKAKNIIIRLSPETVELILPDGNFKKARDFLLQKEKMIRKKLASYPKQIADSPDSLSIFGIDHQLKHIVSTREEVQHHNNLITIYSSIASKDKILKQFLIDLLLPKIEQIINQIRAQGEFSFSKIKISNNKHTWGSCSSKGVLSFSWRLIFVPLEVLYYVIVHEMCHLIEMNHSHRFWSLVSNFCPDYPSHKLWLKENSHRLYKKSLHLSGKTS